MVRKSRKTTVILIVIAAVIAVGTIALLIYNRRKKIKNESFTQSAKSAVSSAVTSGYVPESFPLKKGMYGEAIRAMQVGLISSGYSCGTYGSDGKFGSATLDAVRKKFNSPNKSEVSEWEWDNHFRVFSKFGLKI